MMWMRTGAAALAFALVFTPDARAANGTLDCLIEPYVVVAVGASVDGVLEAVTVDRGDIVTKGQVVATLESSVEATTVELARARATVEAALKARDAQFAFGVRRFERTEELFKQNLVPLREMDEAETQKVLAEIAVLEGQENRRLAELELKRAEAALAVRTVKSPIAGVVVERLLAPGEYSRVTPVVRVAQIDPLRVEVIVPVALLGRIRLGMRAQVFPEAPLRDRLSARVTIVDRVVDAASGTFGVRLELPNPGHRIAAGLKCKVRFPD